MGALRLEAAELKSRLSALEASQENGGGGVLADYAKRYKDSREHDFSAVQQGVGEYLLAATPVRRGSQALQLDGNQREAEHQRLAHNPRNSDCIFKKNYGDDADFIEKTQLFFRCAKNRTNEKSQYAARQNQGS
ncbi:hypothetical protein ACLKA6_017448 [Drosophila palustris]